VLNFFKIIISANIVMLSVIIFNVIMLGIIMLSVVTLNVFVLGIIMPSVVTLNVIIPGFIMLSTVMSGVVEIKGWFILRSKVVHFKGQKYFLFKKKP
jgi:hypothetical protein